MVTGTSLHWLLVESWIFLCFDNFFSNITKNNIFMLKNKSTNELSVELHVENVLIINKKKIWYKIFTFNSQHMYFFVNLRKDITDCNVTVSLTLFWLSLSRSSHCIMYRTHKLLFYFFENRAVTAITILFMSTYSEKNRILTNCWENCSK